mmetsp:Transcript_93076/g.221348  ORF Transcript_93076/g.221348 Transcript_93076/m.221348 type:complete len:241 (+) Transcript_93076:219-941(+)
MQQQLLCLRPQSNGRRQHGVAHLLALRGHIRHLGPGSQRLHGPIRLGHVDVARRREGQLAAQELKQHHPQAEDICLGRELRRPHFRSHEVGRAYWLLTRLLHRLRGAEIRQHHMGLLHGLPGRRVCRALRREDGTSVRHLKHEVLALDIQVHDASAMHMGERRQHLIRHLHREQHWHLHQTVAPCILPVIFHNLLQVPAHAVLQHQIPGLGILEVLKKVGHVRVVQRLKMLHLLFCTAAQ